MNKTSIISSILFTIFLLTSCSHDRQSPPFNIPDVDVQAENWNTSIKLVDDPVLSNSHKNEDILILRLENLSDTPIAFPENFGMKVITWDGQSWVSIQNNFYNAGSKVLPTKRSYPLGFLVTASPYVPNLSSSTSIRVIVVGHAQNNDKESLGAYIDVVLNP